MTLKARPSYTAEFKVQALDLLTLAGLRDKNSHAGGTRPSLLKMPNPLVELEKRLTRISRGEHKAISQTLAALKQTEEQHRTAMEHLEIRIDHLTDQLHQLMGLIGQQKRKDFDI